MKEDVHLSESQMSEILDKLEARLMRRTARDQGQIVFVKPRLNGDENPAQSMGRPKSQYTGQLHLSVLKEDEIWFKKTAQANDLQYGKFVSCLRKLFEIYG